MYKILYHSATVLVRKDETKWETYDVLVAIDGTTKKKKFRGETAWMDAERFAYDHDRDAIGCTSL